MYPRRIIPDRCSNLSRFFCCVTNFYICFFQETSIERKTTDESLRGTNHNGRKLIGLFLNFRYKIKNRASTQMQDRNYRLSFVFDRSSSLS
jgi:hypothetical protein